MKRPFQTGRTIWSQIKNKKAKIKMTNQNSKIGSKKEFKRHLWSLVLDQFNFDANEQKNENGGIV